MDSGASVKNAFAILLFVLSGWFSLAHATAQAPDVILIDGKEYSLNTNPLDRYLDKLGDKAPRFEAPHTALWRGYVATWELAQGKLYLRKVEGHRDLGNGADDAGKLNVDGMKELFPDKSDVVADWYTGTLIIPNGEQVEYVHMGYGSTYAKYIVVSIKDGIETERHNLSLEEFERFRDERFARYKQTDAYKKQAADNKTGKHSMPVEQFDQFLKEFEAERYLSVP